jgi:hypothetical protein
MLPTILQRNTPLKRPLQWRLQAIEKVLGGSLDADERTSTRLQNETRQEYDLLSKRKQWQMLTD